jgi:hypothetical protein
MTHIRMLRNFPQVSEISSRLAAAGNLYERDPELGQRKNSRKLYSEKLKHSQVYRHV